VTATGYVRTSSPWLLKHSEEVKAKPTALRRRYGPEVEEELVLASQDVQSHLRETLHAVLAKHHRKS
jgi:hypothetical protein